MIVYEIVNDFIAERLTRAAAVPSGAVVVETFRRIPPVSLHNADRVAQPLEPRGDRDEERR